MLDPPDLTTLRLCSILASAAFATVFVVLWRGRRGQPWLIWWGMSSILYCAVLIAFQILGDRPAPVLWAIPILSGLSLTNALILAGVRAVDGLPPFRPWMIAVVIATGLVAASPQWMPQVTTPASRGAVLSLCLGANVVIFSIPLLVSGARDGSRTARRTAGAALLGYLPAYLLAVLSAADLGPLVSTLAMAAMLSDQMLLPLLNLSLLAIPGLKSQHALREAAMRDPLTGAWNRAILAEREATMLRPGHVVMLVDIDHFKTINDEHGHALGDMVLIAIASSLARHVAAGGGHLVRLGGDEFLVVMPPGGATAEQVAAEVHATACRGLPGLPEFSVSVGVAAVLAGDTTLAAVMARADRLLYRAKDDGRGRVAA